jgi:hypothetical protein
MNHTYMHIIMHQTSHIETNVCVCECMHGCITGSVCAYFCAHMYFVFILWTWALLSFRISRMRNMRKLCPLRIFFLSSRKKKNFFFWCGGGLPLGGGTSKWQLHYNSAAFSSQLKSKIGNILAKAADLRIILNIDDSPVVSRSHTHSSHSETSRLWTSSLSLGVPVPHD